MGNFNEIIARIKDHFYFNKQELFGLLIATIVVGFVFSFRHWGIDQFNLAIGLKNFAAAILIAGISLFFKVSCQKIFGLGGGQSAEFKVWWNGIVIMLIVAFITKGWVPLVLVGGVVSSFMIRQRLGEFRYGFSTLTMGATAMWAILGALIMAILFAIGLHFFPQSFFFSIGVQLNLWMALCSWLPLPQQDGLALFFGSKILFFLSIFLVLLTAVLLLTQTTIGLIIAIVLATIIAIGYLLIRSEK